jgi:hypothetical protein
VNTGKKEETTKQQNTKQGSSSNNSNSVIKRLEMITLGILMTGRTKASIKYDGKEIFKP